MKNAKKLLALLLAMTMLFALCACGDDNKDDEKEDKKDTTTTAQAANADPSASASTSASAATTTQTNQNASAAPLGSWECDGMYLTLESDGTGTLGDNNKSIAITWQMKDGNVLHLVNEESEEEIVTFTLSGNTMTFVTEDNSTMVWTKAGTAPSTNPTTQPSANVNVSYNPELVGMWTMGEYSMNLRADGTGQIIFGDQAAELTWNVSGSTFTVEMAGDRNSFAYALSGNELTFTYDDGEIEVWTK